MSNIFENTECNNYVLCPNCGSSLEIINSHWYSTCKGHAKNTIFHCNTCHIDWEKDEEYVAQPVIFKQKYWG